MARHFQVNVSEQITCQLGAFLVKRTEQREGFRQGSNSTTPGETIDWRKFCYKKLYMLFFESSDVYARENIQHLFTKWVGKFWTFQGSEEILDMLETNNCTQCLNTRLMVSREERASIVKFCNYSLPSVRYSFLWRKRSKPPIGKARIDNAINVNIRKTAAAKMPCAIPICKNSLNIP